MMQDGRGGGERQGRLRDLVEGRGWKRGDGAGVGVRARGRG